MSDPTETGERDSAGRFVRRATETVHSLHTPSDEGVHPMAKILFGWTERKGIASALFWGLLIVSLALIAVDVLILRHDYFEFANSTGFYGLYGFAAFAFAVVMGWPLGRLLRRGENFYGDAGGPPADVDPDRPAEAADESPEDREAF